MVHQNLKGKGSYFENAFCLHSCVSLVENILSLSSIMEEYKVCDDGMDNYITKPASIIWEGLRKIKKKILGGNLV